MNPTLSDLLSGMRRALREDVAPDVHSAHARGQMAGVIDILNKLEGMVAWSPDMLGEELAILDRGSHAIAELMREYGVTNLPPPDAELARPTSQSELESRVESGRRHLMDLTDWLFDPTNPLSAEQRKGIDAKLRKTIRDAMGPQRRLTARADFAGMTGEKG